MASSWIFAALRHRSLTKIVDLFHSAWRTERGNELLIAYQSEGKSHNKLPGFLSFCRDFVNQLRNRRIKRGAESRSNTRNAKKIKHNLKVKRTVIVESAF